MTEDYGMSKPDFKETIKKLDVTLDGRTDNIGPQDGNFEIKETDFNLQLKDDYLWDVCERFDFNDPPVDPEKLSMAMVTYMREGKGVGLAANQVGYNIKMFVTEGEPAFAIFNPTITFKSPNFTLMDEGCLSFPGLMLKVSRPSSIRVRFQDPYGNWITKQFAGMSARIFQHEIDHLEGVDFTEKVSKMKLQLAQRRAIKRLRHAT